MDHPKDLNCAVNLGLWARLHRCEQGQTASLWLMIMMVASSVFLGAAWDMSNAWMHKQWADTAAQAACAAGSMDMVWAANNIPVGSTPTTPVPGMNFLPAAGSTNSGNCGGSSNNPICYYAKINGYDGATSNDVAWATSTTPPPSLPTGTTTMTQSSNGVPAFLNVTVTDNVPAYFFGAFAKVLGMSNSWQSVPVVGHCNCGMTATYNAGSTSTDSLVNATNYIGGATCNTGPGNGSMTCNASISQVSFPVSQAVAANQTVTFSVNLQVNMWVNCCSASASYSAKCGTTWATVNGYTSGASALQSVPSSQTATFTCAPGTITNTNQAVFWGSIASSSEPENYQTVSNSVSANWAGADISTPGTAGGWTNIKGASFQNN